MELLTIGNNSQEITSTNYFESEYNLRGYFYISINAGCVRLLIPDRASNDQVFISDITSAKEIVLSMLKKYLREEGKQSVELMFDDHSENPYCLHVATNQIDRLPLAEDDNSVMRFISYAKDLRVIHDTKCGFRYVNRIPCMAEWRGAPL